MKQNIQCTSGTVQLVAPYVGAWIETSGNTYIDEKKAVAPYVGAWIETPEPIAFLLDFPSLPTWERGLKPISIVFRLSLLSSLPTWERGLKPDGTEEIGEEYPVAPYVGAWIETTI